MRFATLVSGNGTNLQALIDAERAGRLAPGEIALVISNRPGVRALERAAAADIRAVVIDHHDFEGRAEFETALLEELGRSEIEAVILAGFMRVLTERFVGAYQHRILNTHPALCPAFPGLHAPRQAIEHGVKLSGCTVHFVDRGVDTGPVILQGAVPVLPDDDQGSLHDRIRAVEHDLLPRAAQLLAAGRLSLSGRRVVVEGEVT